MGKDHLKGDIGRVKSEESRKGKIFGDFNFNEFFYTWIQKLSLDEMFWLNSKERNMVLSAKKRPGYNTIDFENKLKLLAITGLDFAIVVYNKKNLKSMDTILDVLDQQTAKSKRSAANYLKHGFYLITSSRMWNWFRLRESFLLRGGYMFCKDFFAYYPNEIIDKLRDFHKNDEEKIEAVDKFTTYFGKVLREVCVTNRFFNTSVVEFMVMIAVHTICNDGQYNNVPDSPGASYKDITDFYGWKPNSRLVRITLKNLLDQDNVMQLKFDDNPMGFYTLTTKGDFRMMRYFESALTRTI